MSDDAESERLLDIARAIASGDQIKWEDETRRVTGSDSTILGALQALESIASAQRDIQKSPTSELTHWGHLTIVSRVRSGAAWTWYRARDAGRARDVSLLLAGPLGGDPGRVERLLKHARAQTQLHHPHLSTVQGADYAHDHVGLWMELLHGPTIEEWVNARGPLDASEASAIVADLCGAVGALHHAGLVHGSVDPTAIVRTDDGRTVLAASLTAAADAAADIAGLGSTLEFLATGTSRRGADAGAVTPAGDTTAARRLPRSLRPIVARALSTDPATRFATAAELEAALRRTAGALRPGWEWILGFLVAVVLVGLIMWLTASSGTR